VDSEETGMPNDWRKASYSNGSGQCIEAASATGTIAVRDTANSNGGKLVFTADAWRAFAAGIKRI
jgi:hypothetical protein